MFCIDLSESLNPSCSCIAQIDLICVLVVFGNGRLAISLQCHKDFKIWLSYFTMYEFRVFSATFIATENEIYLCCILILGLLTLTVKFAGETLRNGSNAEHFSRSL